MPRFADHLTSTADVLLSSSDNGEVRVNLGIAQTGEGIAAEAPVWGVAGFVARPNPPDPTGNEEALYIVEGNVKRVVATRDNRYAAKVGNLAEGDRAIVSNCDARVLLKNASSQVVLYSANQTDNGSTMLVSVNGSTGETQIVNGSSYIKVTKDSIELNAGGSILRLDSHMVAMFAAWFSANTSGGNLGYAPGVVPPSPLAPSASSALTGLSGPAGAPSGKWFIQT